jgi:hypothetical protein
MGMKFSEETKAKQSAAKIGNQHAKGMKDSMETRVKKSTTASLRWAKYRFINNRPPKQGDAEILYSQVINISNTN